MCLLTWDPCGLTVVAWTAICGKFAVVAPVLGSLDGGMELAVEPLPLGKYWNCVRGICGCGCGTCGCCGNSTGRGTNCGCVGWVWATEGTGCGWGCGCCCGTADGCGICGWAVDVGTEMSCGCCSWGGATTWWLEGWGVGCCCCCCGCRTGACWEAVGMCGIVWCGGCKHNFWRIKTNSRVCLDFFKLLPDFQQRYDV